jgi:hypothetical protein
MICIGNLKKRCYISTVSVAKPLPLHRYMLESFALSYADFCMDLYRVDSDESLQASSLKFLRSVTRFIAEIFFSVLNALSPFLFKEIIVLRFITVTC